jgi:phage antirepressor YoqD-like protein
METRIEMVRIGEDEVAVVRGPDGDGYAVLRRMCEVLGVDAEGQRQKLSRSEWACALMIKAHDSTGREQNVFCLHVKSVAMWLATIDANRVAEDVRPKVIRFQREAADALYRWASGQPRTMTLAEMTLAVVQGQQSVIAEQQARLAIAEPKAAIHDQFLVSGDSVSLRKAAQVLKRGQREWNEELIEAKYLYRENPRQVEDIGRLRPYQKWVDAKLFEVREACCGDGRWRPETLVTAEGIAYFARAYAQMAMVLR